MLLSLDPGIGQVVDLNLQSHLFPGGLDHLRELQDSELLGELVEDTELALLCRIQACDLNAAHGIANVQEAAGLSALAINRERVTQSGLCTETIQHRPKNF